MKPGLTETRNYSIINAMNEMKKQKTLPQSGFEGSTNYTIKS
jgi:hypothetical protein